MQRLATDMKPQTHDNHRHAPVHIDHQEILRAASASEGVPVEWAIDHVQSAGGSHS